MRSGQTSPKFEGIQVLRFVAAALVVVTHATLYTQERLVSDVHLWHFGEIGVDIFFVISGFVMVVSVQKLLLGDDAAYQFAVRRLIRIVPMYWLATTAKIVALLVVPGAVLHAALGVRTVGLSYLFLPSTNVEGDVTPVLAVGWTLTYEMFFYAVFTLALVLRANVLLFCGSILSALAVTSLFAQDSWPAATVYASPRVLYFLAGMVIGTFIVRRDVRRFVAGLSYVVGLYLAIEVVAALSGDGSLDLWDNVFRHLVSVLLVLLVVVPPVAALPMPRWATFLGDASYSLYLFHPLIAPLVPAALSFVGLQAAGLSVVLCIVTSLCAASVIYWYVERPVTAALQRRWLRRRTTTPDAPVGVTRGTA